MQNDLEKLIEQGERVREEKKWDESLEIFDRAIIEAANQEKPEILINILSQKLIIYKHLYYETKNLLFLELFFGEANTGLQIAERFHITGQPKAVMALRIADYHFLKQDYQQALEFYELSLKNLDPKNKGEYGEYLGHLGLAQILSGDKRGFATLDQAFQSVSEDKSLRPFHKLIILSGIRLRQAQGYGRTADKQRAEDYLAQAEDYAKQVNEDHQLPLRLEEVERLRSELNL